MSKSDSRNSTNYQVRRFPHPDAEILPQQSYFSYRVGGTERESKGMRKLRAVLIVVLLATLFFSITSGSSMVMDDPQHADVILILAGETDHRPSRGLELLSKGYAPRLIMDVPAGAKIYGSSLMDIASAYMDRLPEKGSMSLCPIVGLSTKAETQDADQCLKGTGARSVLLVTSDYHTRRALSIFRHELPQYRFSVAAAHDQQQFGTSWWNHRQWAKLNFDEWIRTVWWYGVDRWR